MTVFKDFPYPVLSNNSLSGYSNDSFYKIDDVSEPEYVNKSFKINLSFSLGCTTIANLLENNKCSIYIGYSSNLSRKMKKIDSIEENYSLEIPIKNLQSIDKIKVYSYIIAEEDFSLSYETDMQEHFNIGESLPITKKDILGYSNELQYFYNRTGETIIQFSEVSEENFNDFQVDINGDNYINIKISKRINEGYTRIKENNKAIYSMPILNASFVHLAINYTISEIAKNGYQNYENKRWFKVLNQVFVNKSIDFKKELDDLSIELDNSKIYELTQIFMNHYFEKSIELVGKGL